MPDLAWLADLFISTVDQSSAKCAVLTWKLIPFTQSLSAASRPARQTSPVAMAAHGDGDVMAEQTITISSLLHRHERKYTVMNKEKSRAEQEITHTCNCNLLKT